MRKTSLYTYIPVLMLTISACVKKVRPMESTVTDRQPTVEYDQSVAIQDTVSKKEEVRVDQPTSKPVTNTPTASYSSREVEYDNMRGFDPASEDDMDDNGMGRYMDNNDEEGWD